MKGILPSSIPYALGEEPPKLTSAECERRIRELAPEWVEERYERPEWFSWKNNGSYVDYKVLERLFTWEERVFMWIKSVTQSRLTDHIEQNEELLWKIDNVMWRYFGRARDWHGLRDALESLRRIPDRVHGLDVRLTWTRSSNTHAWSWHEREVYLDAAMGLLFYKDGVHVMTASFAMAQEGLLVAQAQLRKKKGNRFLYGLPKHYLEVVLDVLGDAFGRENLLLVDGKSAVSAVHKAYEIGWSDKKCELTPEDDARIAGVYDRPLEGWEREAEPAVDREWRKYVRLRVRTASVRAA